MQKTMWERAGALGWSLGICAAIAALAGMSGCATPGGGLVADNRPDLMTDSDEPEARKRARVRLQLAVGYFEQGQTTVALDELKQSLVIDPSFSDAYNLRGLIYLRLNDQRLAEDSFRRAITLNLRESNTLHNYGWMLCQQSAGQFADAERSLARSYELDAGNPITGYNLASLLYRRGDLVRAQFYIRRLNNSELANAESLWLGIKVERRMDNREAMQQLTDQLKKRFAQSKELVAFERGAFDE